MASTPPVGQKATLDGKCRFQRSAHKRYWESLKAAFKKRFTANGTVPIINQLPQPPQPPPPTQQQPLQQQTGSSEAAPVGPLITATSTNHSSGDISSGTSSSSNKNAHEYSTVPIATFEADGKFIAEHENLPKEVLLKKMREAKGEYSDLEGTISAIDSKRDDLDVRCGVIRLQWNLLLHDLVIVAKALGLDPPLAHDLPRDEYDANETKRELLKAKNSARSLAAQVLEAIQSWMKQNEKLHREYKQNHDHQEKQQLLAIWITNEIAGLQSTYKSNYGLVEELIRQHKSISGLLERAIYDTKSTEEQLQQANAMLDESMEKLVQAEKRFDRLDSKTVAAFLTTNKDDRSPSHRDSSVSLTQTNTASQVKEPVSTSPEITEEQMVKEHRLIVDARTRELQELRREKQQLMDDLERLRGKFMTLTDEQLMATEYFKTLQLSLEHYKARAHYLEDIKIQLEMELDDAKAERRKLADEVKTEKGTQEAAIEGEMKRLENDLQRIRKQHNDYQQIADTQVSKKTREAELYDATLIDTQKQAQRISHLENRLSELRTSIQDSTSPYKDFARLYNKIHTRISDARIVLDLLESNDINDLAKDPQLKTEFERKFAFWEQVGNTREEIRSLMTQVDQKFSEYSKIELMISFFVNNESQLMTQIDRAGAIFTKLEDQSSKSVFNFSQRNDQKAKLQAEKSKYAHTFGSLKAAKEKQAANVAALRRTSEQQLEHIRQLEDREKSIEKQVCEKENEVRKTVHSLEEHRSTVEDLQYQCSEIRISLEHSDDYFHELQKIIKDKTKALDEEKQLRKRVDEDYEKMQRKWNTLSQGDCAATEQLFQECEELRTLLKCGACRTRFRKRLLSRCMHTFCAECIEARLETRQRRCPTCGESFGVNDVRPFIL